MEEEAKVVLFAKWILKMYEEGKINYSSEIWLDIGDNIEQVTKVGIDEDKDIIVSAEETRNNDTDFNF